MLFCMFYVALPLCAQIILHKQAILFNQVISAGSLVAPLWFTLGDVIAEIYGYQASRNMFYGMLLVDLVF
jgi:queuosine precursor transporter